MKCVGNVSKRWVKSVRVSFLLFDWQCGVVWRFQTVLFPMWCFMLLFILRKVRVFCFMCPGLMTLEKVFDLHLRGSFLWMVWLQIMDKSMQVIRNRTDWLNQDTLCTPVEWNLSLLSWLFITWLVRLDGEPMENCSGRFKLSSDRPTFTFELNQHLCPISHSSLLPSCKPYLTFSV